MGLAPSIDDLDLHLAWLNRTFAREARWTSASPTEDWSDRPRQLARCNLLLDQSSTSIVEHLLLQQ